MPFIPEIADEKFVFGKYLESVWIMIFLFPRNKSNSTRIGIYSSCGKSNKGLLRRYAVHVCSFVNSLALSAKAVLHTITSISDKIIIFYLIILRMKLTNIWNLFWLITLPHNSLNLQNSISKFYSYSCSNLSFAIYLLMNFVEKQTELLKISNKWNLFTYWKSM